MEKRKAPMDIAAEMTITGLMILTSEIPEDLNASNSRFSARFPKVIRLASRTARGMARGTSVTVV